MLERILRGECTYGSRGRLGRKEKKKEGKGWNGEKKGNKRKSKGGRKKKGRNGRMKKKDLKVIIFILDK